MDQATHNKIVSFIWGIADDVLRDLVRRGKYPDVILPMCVIRRMDAGQLDRQVPRPDIDLSPAGIDNHSMGTVFEELVRKFNEDNNEEAGEHWTPRDAVRLMANLVFLPIQEQIKSGTYLLYDCACGTGGMLTVAEETLAAIAAQHGQQAKGLLYGQEINPETYAVCKVLPYTPDAWVNNDATKIGYEVSFTRHFYKPKPLRTLAEISADILAVEKEAEGLLDGLLVKGQPA